MKPLILKSTDKISAHTAKMMSVKKQARYARVRQPGEVLPPQIDTMHREVYVPPKPSFVRPGADDYKKIKSLGIEGGSATYPRSHK